ncbi:MAG: ATP synthase gamma chain [Candidatus Omnitrophica bacterium]|nr:ATP synthase gamma chain [Candidatus Omnitrophota bacterium]
MASLRQIRRRMKSIENIHEITKAMEMIAAFRFKKAENRFSRSRAYLGELEKLVGNLAAAAGRMEDPLFERRELKRKTLVVMTGDKGLCGAYNSNLLRTAQGWMRDNAAYELSVLPIGKVGAEFFRRKKAPLIGTGGERGAVDAAYGKRLNEELKQLFLSGRTDSVEILHTNYRVGGTGQNVFTPFLSLSWLMDRPSQGLAEYIYEPGFKDVFLTLLSRYLEGKVYLTLLESVTSEYSARMVAMKQATENGEEVLDSLKLLRNKTRQATITRELSEIVGGAAALV